MGRATLIDERNPEQDDQEFADVTDTGEENVAEAAPEPAPEPDDDLPEKYRGKSLKEIVEMHREAEKALGRQSSEVGEFRKLADELVQLKAELVNAPKADEPPLEEIDFFADPDKAVDRKLASHPSIKKAEETSEQFRRQVAVQALESKHPGWQELIQETAFQEWVTKSNVRKNLLKQADNYDAEAADELFSTWKELKKASTQLSEADKASRKEAVKQASTGSQRGSTEQQGKKKYRRADIIKLMRTDPRRYEQLQPEIMAAYAEGRVI